MTRRQAAFRASAGRFLSAAGENVADLQRLHARAFERDACRYVNFQLVPGGAMLSNPPQQQNAVSAAWVLPVLAFLAWQLTVADALVLLGDPRRRLAVPAIALSAGWPGADRRSERGESKRRRGT